MFTGGSQGAEISTLPSVEVGAGLDMSPGLSGQTSADSLELCPAGPTSSSDVLGSSPVASSNQG